ncbi:MAG: hypothetical protein ABIO63_01515 [Casimicrobiaceae bacterium]
MSKYPGSRTADAAFGLFFVVLAFVILFAAWDSTPFGAVVAALAVGLLGVEAIVSAARDRQSLLSRIGPLP